MKIVYKDNIIKRYCQINYEKMNPENIIKSFSSFLGENICVLEYNQDERFIRTLKIQNMDNNSISIIIIEYNNQNKESFVKNGLMHNYLITINNTNENDLIEFSTTYKLNNNNINKIRENIFNTKSSLLIKIEELYPGLNKYTLNLNNKTCTFILENYDNKMIEYFLQMKDLNLINIYKIIESINNKFVANIDIKLINNETNEYEMIVTENGKLHKYERSYIKDGNNIILIYFNNKVMILPKKHLNKEIKVEIDITEDIEKVENLFKHN